MSFFVFKDTGMNQEKTVSTKESESQSPGVLPPLSGCLIKPESWEGEGSGGKQRM